MNAQIVATIISVAIGSLYVYFLYNRTKKMRPDLIKPSRLQTNENEQDYKYDWNFILGFGFMGFGFGEGIYVICNIFTMYFYNQSYLDITTLIVVSMVYMGFLCRMLDGFMGRYRLRN
jgi:hypothetical protein